MLTAKGRRGIIPLLPFLLIALACMSMAMADTNQDGLLSALKTRYPITEASPDRTQIAQPGVVMRIMKSGISARPWDYLMNFDNLIVDGAVQPRSRWVELTKTTEARLGQARNVVILKPGDLVYITKIDAKTEAKDDLLKISILSCDPFDVDDDGNQKRYAATLDFKMARNSLAESAPDQVEQMVETMLAPDQPEPAPKLKSVASAPKRPRPAAPAANSAPVQPTQNIAMGQTVGQVVAIMGQPTQIVDLGAKKTYTYPNLKIVFVNGKVSDVQ